MTKADGNLGPWLDGLDASVQDLSVGAKFPPAWFEIFQRHLQENSDAHRLIHVMLPKCRVQLLAGFVMLVVSGVDRELIPLSRERRQGFQKIMRAAARKDKSVGERANELVSKAESAFDTRREGLAEYCGGTLILRRYLHYKSGVKPTARELAALLSAGLAASGRLQPVDYDLLRKNLKNYETKHPLEFATGEYCSRIIELTST
jgi:hypothetical protein